MNSAGIIPVIKENGKVYVLLGEDDAGWSAFAGRQDLDETPQETAFREFHEETTNIFTDVNIEFVQRNCFHIYNTMTPTGKVFTMYFVDFSKIDTTNTNSMFQKALKINVCEQEKKRLKWVEINKILKHKLRFSFYKDIKQILNIIYEWEKESVIDSIILK